MGGMGGNPVIDDVLGGLPLGPELVFVEQNFDNPSLGIALIRLRASRVVVLGRYIGDGLSRKRFDLRLLAL